MKTKFFASMFLLALFCSCSGGQVSIDDPSLNQSQLEQKIYDTTPDGEQVLRVVPNINSRDELIRYREFKRAEAAKILSITEDASAEKPYYPAVITLAKPLTIAQFNELISNYNPSVKKAMMTAGPIKTTHLEKAEIVKDVDKIIPSVIKFNSTTGRGQLHYETMADEEQLARLEEGLAAKEKELNSIENYQLVAGIRSFVGGVHRDNVIGLFDDSRIFLADIGPADLYEGNVTHALWDDVSDQAERYLSHQ
ncbi:MAG: hypothetical protein ABH871_01345 [Pseudomonadota bacterium]